MSGNPDPVLADFDDPRSATIATRNGPTSMTREMVELMPFGGPSAAESPLRAFGSSLRCVPVQCSAASEWGAGRRFCAKRLPPGSRKSERASLLTARVRLCFREGYQRVEQVSRIRFHTPSRLFHNFSVRRPENETPGVAGRFIAARNQGSVISHS